MLFNTTGIASASSITATYTADNATDGVYLIDLATKVVSVGNMTTDWRDTGSTTFGNLAPNQEYALLFHAYNYLTDSDHTVTAATNNIFGSNPAALIAQLTGDIIGGPVFSSGTWEYSLSDLSNSANNAFAIFNNYTNPIVSTYGANGVSPWGNVGNIDSSALWIWSGQADSMSGNDGSVYLMTEFKTSPVPEPATMLLFGTGLLGLASVIRRKIS